ncbi:SPOR domain-containing protein [Novosphingobium malaysiense]|uniref:Sporulation protein SsgA n=1 Tax=Novosphingobium malaysiense TaxID=1348853 RepID=A0A0B1ZL53_9SPHN|nr:SPOR domain-containing protein [Novosphingobium malaysiense]KHK91291.1 sporulation protein SsgA [Novosphingobium malaysiense]
MRLPVNRVIPFAALLLLGTGPAIAKDHSEKQTVPVTGPAADYPVVIGDPFTIGDTVWTPTDQLNYDAVGYATVGGDDVSGVTGAHKTLPLPSYVEVTALDSGKTILLRLEQRGPMVNDVLIQLSPMAAEQLGLAPGSHSPVRVRRVNPPEPERALLRTGKRAPERMETPDGLLKVLRRKLADQAPLRPPPSTPPEMPTGVPAETAKAAPTPGSDAKPAAVAQPVTSPPAAAPVAPAAPAPAAAKQAPKPASSPAAEGSLVVQVAAFSVEANAHKAARQLGANVSHPGKYWLVQLGPFANSAQATPALEKARRAGYRDARIQSAD